LCSYEVEMSELRANESTDWEPLLPWQEAVAREALARRSRWPHALLITGRRGIGKRALALHFA
jgi:hypothetical protein